MGNTTITPTAGALAFAGLATVIPVVPGAGSVTFSGNAPLVNANIVPGAGALGVAGVAPGLFYNVEGTTAITPPVGSLTLTTAISTSIAPPAGALVVDQDAGSGVSYRPNVHVGYAIQPPTGALVLTTFGQTTVITPPAGSLSIMDPNNIAHTITPPVGALAFDADGASYTPIVGGGHSLTPLAGALLTNSDGTNNVPLQLLTLPPPATAVLALTGYPPQVGSHAVRIVEPSGALAFAGLPPVISILRTIVPGVGALSISGNAVNETLGFGISPAAGALSLTGQLASVSNTRVPNVGALALVGAPPTLQQGTVLVVPSGALGLPGAAPGRVAIQPVAIPAEDDLFMPGYPPIISTSQTIQPPYGVLGVFGSAPIVEAPVQITPFPGSLGFAGNPPAQAPTSMYQVDPYYYVPGRSVGGTVTWPPLSASESIIGTFNFGDELEAGELLLGPINLTIQVSAGVDPNPMHIVDGALALDPTQTMVFVPISNGTPGVTYYFIVNVQTTNPYKKLTRYALLPITAAATPGVNSVNTTVAPSTGGLVTVGTSVGRTP